MNKLLIISGPTATGKTRLALKLAKKFNGELVSADSRQVYKYMDIITGKDLSVKFKSYNSNLVLNNKNIGFYSDGELNIWGYDIFLPDEECNASDYANIARYIVKNIWQREKLPIVVGGTGFYINALLGKYSHLDIPKNEKLRNKLAKFSVEELYQLLLKRAPARALSLNNSDKNNARRLTRAIEIAEFSQAYTSRTKELPADILWIGLNLPLSDLKIKIAKRVKARLGLKMDREIKYLQDKGYLYTAPARTLGYKQWLEYLNGNCTKEEAVDEWIRQEYKYAKRQIVWFKKQKEIMWFDTGNKYMDRKLSVRVRKWYS